MRCAQFPRKFHKSLGLWPHDLAMRKHRVDVLRLDFKAWQNVLQTAGFKVILHVKTIEIADSSAPQTCLAQKIAIVGKEAAVNVDGLPIAVPAQNPILGQVGESAGNTIM